MNFMDVVMQWVHVSSVAVAVGGIFALRFVVCPAAKLAFPDDEAARDRLARAIVSKFKLVVHGAIGLLIVSGGYLLWDSWGLLRSSPAYRHAIEMKILLALGIFFIAIMLTVSKSEPNYFQRNRDCWLAVNFGLALIVIALAAFLRHMH